jgi:dihydrofolate synthase/folylpolyglutamate synthase
MHTFRERIAIDDEPISERAFSIAFERALAAAVALESDQPDLGRVTAFELVTAAAFDHFARAGCDIAIIETGLGGRWDASNIVDPLVSVITLIDLEHTEILGDTLAKIAREKAGIIKPGRPVVTLDQDPDVLDVFQSTSRLQHAELAIEGHQWTINQDWRAATFRDEHGEIGPVRLGMHGSHQVRNAGLALAAIRRLPGFTIPASAIAAGLANAWLPGRYEVVPAASPSTLEFVIDGAHSQASAAALVRTVLEHYPTIEPNDIGIVFSMLKGKDAAGFARELVRVSPDVTLVPIASLRAMPLDELEAAAREAGATITRAANVADAIQSHRSTGKKVVVITGSLALAAEARIALGIGVPEIMPQAFR